MRRFLMILSLLLYTTGCAPQLAFQLSAPAGIPPQADRTARGIDAAARSASGFHADETRPGLLVRTHDDGRLLFAENGWKLTLEGIAGNAMVTGADGTQYAADTTLSYWDASSAAATGRNSTMSQFLLTILGVILVLGLAAIILYAAFLATAR